MEKKGRAEVEESARELEDPHLDEKEDSLGNAVEEVEVNDISGHDVSVHNGDWLAWIGFAFWVGCLAARDCWLVGLAG